MDQLVRDQGWSSGKVDEVYVSAGPGSFTGIRIGIAVARTMAWATAARLVRVPSMDALAVNALDLDSPPAYLATALDAKRKQVFAAFFLLETDSGGLRQYRKLEDARMVDPPAFLEEMASRYNAAGRIAVLGEGLAMHRAAAEKAGAAILPPEFWSARAESIYRVGRQMAAAGEYCASGDCVPLYVRLPEPEEKWQQAQKSCGT